MDRIEVVASVNKIESGLKGSAGNLRIINNNIVGGADASIPLNASASNVALFPTGLTCALFAFLRADLPVIVEMQSFLESTVQGTIAVQSGSKSLAGTGTAFSSQLSAGDVVIIDPDGVPEALLCESVGGDTSATMKYAVKRQTATGLSYKILKADNTWNMLRCKQFVGDGMYIGGLRVSNPNTVAVNLKQLVAGL